MVSDLTPRVRLLVEKLPHVGVRHKGVSTFVPRAQSHVSPTLLHMADTPFTDDDPIVNVDAPTRCCTHKRLDVDVGLWVESQPSTDFRIMLPSAGGAGWGGACKQAQRRSMPPLPPRMRSGRSTSAAVSPTWGDPCRGPRTCNKGVSHTRPCRQKGAYLPYKRTRYPPFLNGAGRM